VHTVSNDVEDLIGNNAEAPAKPKVKKVVKAKPAAPKEAKPAAPKEAKPAVKAKAKVAKAAKPAKAAPIVKAVRGKGKWFFPVTEQVEVAKKMKPRIKGPITTKELSEKMDIPTWKIRNASKILVLDKSIKAKKQGAYLLLTPA
jgi:hypothetical protein